MKKLFRKVVLFCSIVFSLLQGSSALALFIVPNTISPSSKLSALTSYLRLTKTSQKLPLLILLHGCKQTPEEFLGQTELEKFAHQYNFFIYAPSQSEVNNPLKCWNWFSPQNLVREDYTNYGELKKIIKNATELVKENPIDPSRIYIAGLSAGAAMAINAAVCYPDIISGVFVHSGITYHAAMDVMSALSAMNNGSMINGATSASWARNCNPINIKQVPAMIVHGDLDTKVIPKNGDIIRDMFEAWNNSLAATSGEPYCETRLLRVPQLPHKWSTREDGLSATEALLDFFKLR